jgi:hypothetical protein
MNKPSLAAQYLAGATYKMIAEDEGLTISMVRNVIIDSGVTPRPRGNGLRKGLVDLERAAGIVERYAQGETLQAIADTLNVTRERVRQIMEKVGVQRRHPVRSEKPVGFRDAGRHYVYFAKAGNGLVKIGCSVQPEERLTQIAEWVPYKIELVATIAGWFDLEAALHKMFAADWSHLEWFRFSPAMERLIDDINSNRPFAITACNVTNERSAAINLKKRMTRKVSHAEAVAFRTSNWSERGSLRPAYAQQALDTYCGSHLPPPTREIIEIIERYAASLLATSATHSGLAA